MTKLGSPGDSYFNPGIRRRLYYMPYMRMELIWSLLSHTSVMTSSALGPNLTKSMSVCGAILRIYWYVQFLPVVLQY